MEIYFKDTNELKTIQKAVAEENKLKYKDNCWWQEGELSAEETKIR